MKKWYRVTERFSPLCGADVYGEYENHYPFQYMPIEKIRRFDVFAGDRPFQLLTPDGENDLGLTINTEHLEESPIQDEVVEMSSRGSPYGKFVDEFVCSRKKFDDVELHFVYYETASQVAILKDGKKIASHTSLNTETAGDEFGELQTMFEDYQSADELVLFMKGIQ